MLYILFIGWFPSRVALLPLFLVIIGSLGELSLASSSEPLGEVEQTYLENQVTSNTITLSPIALVNFEPRE